MIVSWMGWESGFERVVNTFKIYFGDKSRIGFGNRFDERGGQTSSVTVFSYYYALIKDSIASNSQVKLTVSR